MVDSKSAEDSRGPVDCCIYLSTTHPSIFIENPYASLLN